MSECTLPLDNPSACDECPVKKEMGDETSYYYNYKILKCKKHNKVLIIIDESDTE